MAVSRPIQKPAPVIGLSVNGNSAVNAALSTAERWYPYTTNGGAIAATLRSRRLTDRSRCHHVASYRTMTAARTTALSFEKMPTAATAASPACLAAFHVHQQAAKHGQCRQQIGAPDDVRHGFGGERMNGPHRRDAERDLFLARQSPRQRVRQEDVRHLEHKVNRVIARRPVPVSEHGVVDEIRQRGQRPIQTGLAIRPPVRVLEDEGDVRGRRAVDARVREDQSFVVEREAGVEGIRVGEERQQDKRDAGDQVRR
jgi:hypothetical protein